MTAVRIIYPGAQGSAPVVAEWISGKEAEAATVSFATPDGNLITYSADGLKAFEGQPARAEVARDLAGQLTGLWRSEDHTSELQSLMRISYAVLCSIKNTL